MEIVRALVLTSALAVAPAVQSAAVDAGSAASKAEIVAMAHQVFDAFNKGDTATVASLTANVQSIVDEMPPFVWSGPKATDAWLGDVVKDAQVMGDTDGSSVLGPPTYVRIEGDRAYAAFPDHFSYKRHGVTVNEDARWTFTAERTPAGWRIVAWAYSADAHK
jgi:hypothetical protein